MILSLRNLIVAILLFAMLGQGCNSISKDNEPGFLGFKLGMTDDQCDQLLDSLLQHEILNNVSVWKYVHDFVVPNGGRARSVVYFGQQRNSLMSISIFFGSYDVWNNVKIDELVKSEDLEYIFNQYQKKYGKPDLISKEDSVYAWTVGNAYVEFSFGRSAVKEVEHVTETESGEIIRGFKAASYYEYAYISYQFVDSYKKKLESDNFQNSI